MNGLNDYIISGFIKTFEKIVFKLLILGYYSMKNEKSYNLEMEEEELTVELIKHMKKQPIRIEYEITISPEQRYYNNNIYNHTIKPKKAPKPDMILVKWFRSWQNNYEIEYCIEAKNLSENDWKKSNARTSVNAKKHKIRYIETGIDNFINEKYPTGCLTGYIVQGEPENIVADINDILSNVNPSRNLEILKNRFEIYNYPCCYISQHKTIKNNKICLKHFFLKL